MHRFSDGSELNALVGRDVLQICLGEFETQPVFSDDAKLSMESRYVHGICVEGREIAQSVHRAGRMNSTDYRVSPLFA